MLWTPALEVSSFFWRTALPLDRISQPRKEESFVALPRWALKAVSGADRVYMLAASLESSQHCSCTAVVFVSIPPSCAGPLLPPQAGPARVALKWGSNTIPSCTPMQRRGRFCTQNDSPGGKKPSTTTLKLTLGRWLFTHTKCFAVLALIIAHIQT